MKMTKAAGEHLGKMIDTAPSPKPDNMCVRLIETDSGELRLVFDQPNDKDATFSHGDRVVLVIDQGITPKCADRVLDVQATEDGSPGLVLLTGQSPEG